MKYRRAMALITAICWLILLPVHSADDDQVMVTIVNESTVSLNVFFVDSTTRETFFLRELPHGGKLSLQSYPGHEFELREDADDPGVCSRSPDQTCRRTFFFAGEEEDVVLITNKFQAEHTTDPSLLEDVNHHVQPKENVLSILNDSGSQIHLFWIDTISGDEFQVTHDASPIQPGQTHTIRSAMTYQFRVQETGTCDFVGSVATIHFQLPCKMAHFTNPKDENPTVTITRQFHVLYQGETIGQSSQDYLTEDECPNCNDNYDWIHKCHRLSQGDSNKTTQCVQQNSALRILQTHKALDLEESLLQDVGDKLENYTCADDTLETSPPLQVTEWTRTENDTTVRPPVLHQVNRTVWVMLNRPASRIHLVHDFIDEEECQALEQSAKHKLGRGTVADGKGGTHTSDHRKALQAAIVVPWHMEEGNQPIARLSRRVYDYVNHVLGLNIQEHGQESLMSIQYMGRGRDDMAPDRYMPHCDGDCNGLKHKTGTRMATMVMYCTLPTKGGHTNFRNANVHVKPQTGMGVFFSYIDPVTNLTDKQFTEHSGCPVWEGQKKIVTQWVRWGVDKENPWTSFNTLGVKKSEANEWA
ncbi:Prolyl 4-hydroxylase subunit alpha-2 [Seminavis robusta]|uniref:Prolyl 4-hydroxylase subunit alpha-2 n=1 Tax=Seminavis robusta TaxID=568900 RepID=A0A9N8EI00_9STRA|nr:Prolyl 4-hydroxylase subunit alpha-2 [Seminavis robusta]|eukprot:Sro1252_g256280.1 Prolyl 4-hydroxylase subunit alpha-2 (586) ;mRNA; f:17481-19598